MISVAEAFKIVQQNLPTRQLEKLPLAEALDKILAEDITAIEPSPRYTNSAMDGFAVRWEDIKTASKSHPVRLQITGESQAGVPYRGEIRSGQAARISTGAMLCKGADSIVPIEQIEVMGDHVLVLDALKPHQHVRFEGEEFNAGHPLLTKGIMLDVAQVALLASQGLTSTPVYRKAKVAIIVTGTELVPYDQTPQPWQIRDSNGIMLGNAVKKSGGQICLQSRVGDDYKATLEVLREALAKSTIIIFSGGVSVGEHDLVKKAAQDCGFKTLFWQVRQKPGKPLFFARNGETLLFGLPGNPVSAFMCYLYYIHPLLQYLQGNPFTHHFIKGKLEQAIKNPGKRAQFLRVYLEKSTDRFPTVFPVTKQGSHMLTSISQAAGFIFLEEDAVFKSGQVVDVIKFF